jgi:hypothetical protein
MHLMTSSAHSNSPDQLLQAAQKKLLEIDSPFLLRIVSFLRLSCLALEDKGVYSKLLKELSEQDKEWWTTCTITATGTLTSSNPTIKKLLEPVQRLHQVQDLPKAA